ncbi:tRNA guanosine(15) transglycosylase TgtA [Candidatus Bathyarchaeota archaeon]|nr:tRNA guanosine(15) transglycosylase TgtA [Candidatus Bathyarchaeota archaeon]
MSFEIKEKDLLARIGKLETKSGTVETPLMFPVINPVIQSVSPRKIREEFGFEALITNAYILKKRFQNEPIEKGLHSFLDFDGTIMTDSGAYQILVYGDVEVTPEEIVEYQEKIDTDIATILDIPTGWKVSEEYAKQTVKETLKRATELFKLKTRDDILWVGPVQGGRYLNVVAESAKKMGKLPFNIHALGSPTEIMERYRFDVLVDMIMAAKTNLPIERPLHLFGAGHPFMLALAVALGCDLFDSAAYTLYAKENRYMTENGTSRLGELEYFPCNCPKCSRTTPKKVSELASEERQIFLAEHNLYACIAELRRIKQAIRDGRLWEHMEMRAHGHPALMQAVKRLAKYQEFIEKHDPATKRSGLFFFSSIDLIRPEIAGYRKKLGERYAKPKQASVLLLVPQTQTKPFHKSNEYKRVANLLNHKFKEQSCSVHACFYAAPFGLIPLELDEVYPLSQHETVLPLDRETVNYVANQVTDYIGRSDYGTVVLLSRLKDWDRTILNACRKTCRKRDITFKQVSYKEALDDSAVARLTKLLQETLREKS